MQFRLSNSNNRHDGSRLIDDRFLDDQRFDSNRMEGCVEPQHSRISRPRKPAGEEAFDEWRQAAALSLIGESLQDFRLRRIRMNRLGD